MPIRNFQTFIMQTKLIVLVLVSIIIILKKINFNIIYEIIVSFITENIVLYAK